MEAWHQAVVSGGGLTINKNKLVRISVKNVEFELKNSTFSINTCWKNYFGCLIL